MNVIYNCDLFLHRGFKVQWQNKESGDWTQWHGEWYTTHDRRALKLHFDFLGKEERRNWAWIKKDEGNTSDLRVFDGIDYQQRQIVCCFAWNYKLHVDGNCYERIEGREHIDDSDAWEVLV